MLQNILPLLEGWFGENIAKLYNGPPWRSRGLLIVIPVWGAKYVDRFETLCLPSIMSPANLGTLKGRCRLVIFTDKKSYTRLHIMCEGLEDYGIDIDFNLIPDELMATLPKGREDPEFYAKQLNKYWILGVAQNTAMQMAKRAGMAIHIGHPDHIYSENYFPNLFRLSDTYDGIAQTSISANVDGAAEELLKYVKPEGWLTIPDRDLGDIGWRHLHKQTRASLMNTAHIPAPTQASQWKKNAAGINEHSWTGQGDLPESHLWTWVGRDRLHLYCCHMNAAYIAAKYVAKAPSRIPATIDAELPSFMPPTFHVPTIEDGMTFLEVSDESKADNPKRVDIVDLAKHCWLKTRFSLAWMPYVMRACEIPIAEQLDGYADSAIIAAQHSDLVGLLLKLRGPDSLATEFIEGLAFQ